MLQHRLHPMESTAMQGTSEIQGHMVVAAMPFWPSMIRSRASHVGCRVVLWVELLNGLGAHP